MGAFGLGFVQGLATSTDDALKTHIKDNKDRFNKNLEAALSRNLERSTRYDKKSREAQEALDLVAGLTGGDLGRASEIIQGIGGVSQTQGFIDKFRARQAVDKDLKFADVVTFAKEQQGILTPQQSIDQVLTPYSFTTPPQEPKKKGLFSFLDDPRSMAVQAKKEWLARGNTIREAGNIIKRQGAQINYSKLATPEQEVSRETQQLKVQGLKDMNQARQIAIHTSIKNFHLIDPKEARDAAESAARISDTTASTQVRMQALQTAREWDAPKARAAYEASVASTIASKSSDDFGKQYNLLTSEETHFQTELRRIETNQGTNSNEYSIMARRLTDIRLAKSKISLAGLAEGDKDKRWSSISPVTAANAIKADAYTAAGLKFKLGINGRLEMLEEGSAGKVYEAAKNAYNNFQSTYGQYSYEPMKAQAEAMRMNMENAKASYVSKPINAYNTALKNWERDAKDKSVAAGSKATFPGVVKAFKTVNGNKVFDERLRTLPKGTPVFINNQQRLTVEFQKKRGTGVMGVWDGRQVIQRPVQEGDKMPSWTDSDAIRLQRLESLQDALQ